VALTGLKVEKLYVDKSLEILTEVEKMPHQQFWMILTE
jgi:hypothetical protein